MFFLIDVVFFAFDFRFASLEREVYEALMLVKVLYVAAKFFYLIESIQMADAV